MGLVPPSARRPCVRRARDGAAGDRCSPGSRSISSSASPASAWGKAMVAVRDSETAARSIGLNPVTIKTAAFAISAVFAGLAGAIFAPLMMFVAPDSFPFSQSILFLLAVIVGGAGWVLGPVVGAVVTVMLPELLSGLAEYRLLFVGVLLLVVLWLAPEGVIGTLARYVRRGRQGRRGCARLRPLRVAATGARAAKPRRPRHRHRVRRHQGGVACRLHRRARTHHQRDRPERRRQDHRAQHDRRLLPARQPAASASATRELAGAPAWRIARAGIARTYQTTQLFGDDERDRQYPGRAAPRAARRSAPDVAAGDEPARRGSAARLRRLSRAARDAGGRPAACRPAPGRDRARARDAAARAAARRAGRRPDARRQGGAERAPPPDRRPRHRRHPGRARHGARDGHLGPYRRARCRRGHRRRRRRPKSAAIRAC